MRAHQLTTRLLMMTLLFSLLAGVPLASAPAAARQDDKLQVVFSVPGLNFPFFVHMVNIAKEKADELNIDLIVQTVRTTRRLSRPTSRQPSPRELTVLSSRREMRRLSPRQFRQSLTRVSRS